MADEHIVIIDDDADVRESLTLMLEPSGYRLTCCSTGQAGMEAVRAEPPDLILLDIMLASPTEGFHLAYELRQDDALKTIPIIMISSIGETIGMDFAKELGSDYVPVELFIEKPLSAKTVLDGVKETLAKGGHGS